METRKLRIARILQLVLAILLAGFIVLTVADIHSQEGTARVVNYAGIVRGGTQRLVKLEIVGQENQELEDRLDVILAELKTGGDVNQLAYLSDSNYQDCLVQQTQYWEQLKTQIDITRAEGYASSDIVSVSETYFELADATVSAAESYSDKLVHQAKACENGSIVCIILLLFVTLYSLLATRKLSREKVAEIRSQAERDELTGLLNRRSFDRLYEFHLANDEAFILHIVDVDNFKSFNDTYGHSMGDQVLKKVACCLTKNYRSGDYVFRIGGDEFAVLMMGMPEALKPVAVSKIENLQKILKDTGDGVPEVTLSIGAAFSGSQNAGKTLFDAADQALYRVKRGGRDGYAFFEQ